MAEIIYKRAGTNEELHQILELQRINATSVLSKEEKVKEGFVTAHHNVEILNAMNDNCPHIIAKNNQKIIGYALCMLKEFKEKRTLLNQPGSIRVLAKGMNKDGKKDLIALTSQGDETISILYQEDSLTFRSEKVIRFSPIYGISWFELIDYDSDGDDDIILSSFTYVFTPIPDDLSKLWKEKNADITVLENNLIK